MTSHVMSWLKRFGAVELEEVPGERGTAAIDKKPRHSVRKFAAKPRKYFALVKKLLRHKKMAPS